MVEPTLAEGWINGIMPIDRGHFSIKVGRMGVILVVRFPATVDKWYSYTLHQLQI